MSNIRVPVMPEPYRSIDRHISAPITRNVLFAPGSYFTEEQLAARDAQWQEMYGPAVVALKAMLERYVSLVNSGDAGHWDCETEPVVIAARAALSAITEEAPQQTKPNRQLARNTPQLDAEDPWLSGDDMMGSSG